MNPKSQVGAGFYVRDNSMHDNFQRCVVIHDTMGIAVQNNVGYNTNGHSAFARLVRPLLCLAFSVLNVALVLANVFA